ncbi:MAG: phospholipase D-like domain-containing protein [Sphingobacteriales bacterium]|nr:phospholipase D-like domain-containing protein [Sphingobacteriales bacterium]
MKTHAPFPPTNSNTAKLIKGGKIYFDVLKELIQKSKSSIFLQTYILKDDETGKLIAEELIQAAKRNVKVFILLDGFASGNLQDSFINNLKSAGIELLFFKPVFKNNHIYYSRRLHHKVVVVDGRFSLMGGLNIANRYNEINNHKAWLDFAVLLEGEASLQVENYCRQVRLKTTEIEVETNSEIINPFNDIPLENQCNVKIRRNDWLMHLNEISSNYIEMLRNAHHEVLILCSYFIPGKVLRRSMANASRRGVKITVITASQSDVPLTKQAERWLYDWLLRNNIKIYEYQNNVLHGKLAVSDENIVTIGSYNINNLSTYVCLELNAEIKNTLFAQNVQQTLLEIIEKECIEINSKTHHHQKNWLNQFFRWCSYQLLRFVLLMFTFNLKREN